MSTRSVDQPDRRGDNDPSMVPVWEEEDLFARDFEGRLIRVDKATAAELEETIKITVDGHEIEVKKAVPATDEQGNVSGAIRRGGSSLGRRRFMTRPVSSIARRCMRPIRFRPCAIANTWIRWAFAAFAWCRSRSTRSERAGWKPAASCCRPASTASRRR